MAMITESVQKSEKKCELSDRTIETYIKEIIKFNELFFQFAGLNPLDASEEQLEQYIEKCYPHYISSYATLKIHLAAIKYWYGEVKGEPYNRPLPLGPAHEPETVRVLSDEELGRLFEGMQGSIYGTMLRLIYGAGVRLREITQIRVEDLDFEKGWIRLRDEYDNPAHSTILPHALVSELSREVQGKLPLDLLFGQHRFKSGRFVPISRRTLQQVLTRTAQEICLGRITVQMLRDNFAIHTLQNGADPRLLASIMGYSNIRALVKYNRYIRAGEIRIPSPLLASS